MPSGIYILRRYHGQDTDLHTLSACTLLPANGHFPAGVCCFTKSSAISSASWSEILLSRTLCVRPDCHTHNSGQWDGYFKKYYNDYTYTEFIYAQKIKALLYFIKDEFLLSFICLFRLIKYFLKFKSCHLNFCSVLYVRSGTQSNPKNYSLVIWNLRNWFSTRKKYYIVPFLRLRGTGEWRAFFA